METIKLNIDGQEKQMTITEIEELVKELQTQVEARKKDRDYWYNAYSSEYSKRKDAATALKVLTDVALQVSKPFTDELNSNQI